jgi:hypothetical protein
MPDLASFQAYFPSFVAAIESGDVAFRRRMLPAAVPEEQVQMLMEWNRGFFAEAARRGVEPRYATDGRKFEAIYELVDGDGREVMNLEFYHHAGDWISYDPEDPEG